MSRGEARAPCFSGGQEGRGEVTGRVAGAHALVVGKYPRPGVALAVFLGSSAGTKPLPLSQLGTQMCLAFEDFRTKWLR